MVCSLALGLVDLIGLAVEVWGFTLGHRVLGCPGCVTLASKGALHPD